MLNSTMKSIGSPAHGQWVAQTSHISRCKSIDEVERCQAAQVAETLLSCGLKADVQWRGMRATQQSAGEVFIPHLEGHLSFMRSNGPLGKLLDATLRAKAAELTAERLPDRWPDRPPRPDIKGARSDAPQGARGIEQSRCVA